MGIVSKNADRGWTRTTVTFAGLLLILLIISAGAILLLDLFYLQPYVRQMEWAAIREHAIKAEQAGQLEMRNNMSELSFICSAWVETTDARPLLSNAGSTHPLQRLTQNSLARGDVDLAWLTEPSGQVIQVWSKPAEKNSAVVFTHDDLAALVQGLGLPKTPPPRGVCKFGGMLSFFACAPVRDKPDDANPVGYIWAARLLDAGRTEKLSSAVRGQVIFIDSSTWPKGVFFDDTGKPMVRLTEDRALMLTWPVQNPVGRVLGFFSCAINASGLQAYSQAARRSILIVTTLCFGLAILTVVGSHMIVTAPVVRLLTRMNRLLRAGHGTVDELTEGLHGEALVLAGQVGMAISKLSQSSRADPGTGLPNRRNFEEVLDAFYSQASRYHRPLSILVLDVDHFKDINDKLGHLEGDEILRGVAKAINRALRGADRPARLGGDEFAAILPETSAEHAAGVAERIRRAVMELDVPAALGHSITVSIGVADLESGPTDCPQDMFNLADKALYAVKAQGRNKVLFVRTVNGNFLAKEPELQPTH